MCLNEKMRRELIRSKKTRLWNRGVIRFNFMALE
jgi:hypothetical protein